MKNILFLRKMKFAFGSAVLILLVLGAVLARATQLLHAG
jgi:hypothetical protein